MKRFTNFKGLFTLICICFTLSCFSQTTASGDTTSSGKREYVKIEVGMHILDCPVLPPQLKAKLMAYKVSDYVEDDKVECIFFNIPQGQLTAEKIKAIAVSVAFPEMAVNVIVSDKPFAH